MIDENQFGVRIEDIIKEIKVGWNLGNSLESPAPKSGKSSPRECETSWGNPITTKEMILKVIEAGFNVIRIPVTWWDRTNGEAEYKINEEWLNRVQEVVDYAYNEGVYVILNIHHEDEWLWLGNKIIEEKALVILEKIWSQIANRFAEYDYHLMFETMNETRLIGTLDEWEVGTPEAREVINKFNEVVVNTIRNAGKNNAIRPIIVKPIGARFGVEGIEDIRIPDNDSMIILSIHMYEPYYFCMVPEGPRVWGTEADKDELCKLIDSVYQAAQKKGLPLIIGEFGTINKNNEDARAEFTSFFVRESVKRNIACIVWDNNLVKGDEYKDLWYGLFDRCELTWRFPKILRALIDNSEQ